ncbi:MAG TPA: phospholipase D-like domain-containing protein [Terriglobales bacterium]
MNSIRSRILALCVLASIVLCTVQCGPNSAPARQLAVGPEQGSTTAEDHFSPFENLEQIDRQHLLSAQHTLDIAMYAFTDQYLAEAVLDRARAGVQVRIYRDHEQFEQEQRRANDRRASTTEMLSAQPNIQIRVKGTRELMHLKSYLVDGRELRTGSANWSPTGEKRQDNNAHFTTDPQQIKAYQSAFEQMWQRDDNQRVQ